MLRMHDLVLIIISKMTFISQKCIPNPNMGWTMTSILIIHVDLGGSRQC